MNIKNITQHIIYLSLLFTMMLGACKLDKKERGENACYDIESGIVYYTTNLMGKQSKSVLYFKDYGSCRVTDSRVTHMGVEWHTRHLIKDSCSYTLDINNKRGAKMKVENLPDSIINIENLNFSNIPPKISEKYKVQQIGVDTLLGKPCKVFSMQLSKFSHSRFWVWKNIPLSIDFVDKNMHIITKAVEVKPTSNFPDSIFDIPKDFEISDLKATAK